MAGKISGKGFIEEELSMGSLVQILKSALSENDWYGIFLIFPSLSAGMDFRTKINILLKENCISRDLKNLTELMSVIKRVDLKLIIDLHRSVFEDTSDEEFIHKFEKQVDSAELEGTMNKEPWIKKMLPPTEERSVETLVKGLETKISQKEWLRISLKIPDLKAGMPFEAKMEKLRDQGYISGDLTKLAKLMSDIKCTEAESLVKEHITVFHEVRKEEITGEIASVNKESEKWKKLLKEFIKKQNTKVNQVLEVGEPVDLEMVYVPLIIVEDKKPSDVNPDEETTNSKIPILRNKSSGLDFQQELDKLDKPEIWCVIGNSGSGKTIFCQETADRFGKGELPQFLYGLSIPCRNLEWHNMEQTRYNSGKFIDGDYIQNWLCLSMPEEPWALDLAKHISESEGKRLLLIIDSLDEFTKYVPFMETLLFLLLSRKLLQHSTILLTSRPGAYAVISFSSPHDLETNRFFRVLGFSPGARDRYFRLQLTEEKLRELDELLKSHEEIKQLSLIPVNASVITALIRSGKVDSENLDKLSKKKVTTKQPTNVKPRLETETKFSEIEEEPREVYRELIVLADSLTSQEVERLKGMLEIPIRLRDNVTDGRKFLYVLKEWVNHDPFNFNEALESIKRPDLALKARKFPWLAVNTQTEDTRVIEELSAESLVRVLNNEVGAKDWLSICLIITGLKETMSFEGKMAKLIQVGYIRRDLKKIAKLMSVIRRPDIEMRIQEHQKVFHEMSDKMFIANFRREVASLYREMRTIDEMKILLEIIL